MVSVTDLQWKCNSTQLLVQVVIKLTSDDPVALYYENSFREYKKEQQAIDDGGKDDLRKVVNPMVRKRFDDALVW
jgi:hypothetical protein